MLGAMSVKGTVAGERAMDLTAGKAVSHEGFHTGSCSLLVGCVYTAAPDQGNKATSSISGELLLELADL
ncbi:hypothetical protein DSO57_1016593 [Entomophthora muscae]|uniref:Uncharacterized protein n=1 Tax=Entomophthora muscae TaxID=34485 RepID=A0ACC2TS87_9FUNG|nr:hypothetical protein DSO57_1016593 [Entomophthora muscae]